MQFIVYDILVNDKIFVFSIHRADFCCAMNFIFLTKFVRIPWRGYGQGQMMMLLAIVMKMFCYMYNEN